LELDSALVRQIEAKPTSTVPFDSSLLGFRNVVAPFGKNAMPGDGGGGGTPLSRNVHQLPGEVYAASKVAPSLLCVIRSALESQQISGEDITTFLSINKSLHRYDSAFRLFCGVCTVRGLNPLTATLHQLASQLLYLHNLSSAQARNAYSALLFIPGLQQLRFHPLLTQVKRLWNTSHPKYSVFWDAGRVLDLLDSQRLDWNSIEAVRDRLILIFRLLQLYRSVDLERTFRVCSLFQGTLYVSTRRKGAAQPAFEQVISLPTPPRHLLQRYVDLTSHQAQPGSPLLRALNRPFSPLKANSIGSITKRLLEKFGVPVSIFGPHSTRGAGVQLYKRLGMSSEEVCEIGRW
jgi:hypothetical protein